jgi:hypothetical protein
MITCSEAGRKGAHKRATEQHDAYRRKAIRMALAAGRGDLADVIIARGRLL